MAVSLDDIRAAREVVASSGVVRHTPLLESRTLSERAGAIVRLKAENLQHTGSFKVRGAVNRMAALSPAERERGVIAASAGNHAQGLAVAARAAGVRATVVMPATAPLAKVQATRDYGAEVVLAGDSYDDARAEAARLREERGLVEVPAYDDSLIVAGQGTVGLEILDDMPDVALLVVPVGGGGLAAGIAIAAKSQRPDVRVVGVQAEAAPGVARSLAARRIEHVAPQPTLADGIAVGGPGEVTYPLLARYLDDIVLVDDDDIAEAMVLLLERAKLVVEGAGAAAVAALLAGRVDPRGEPAAVVISGGNVDINMLARVVEHGLSRAGRYCRLRIAIDDRPGQLAVIARIIGEHGANILSVSHQRFGVDLPVGRVEAVVLLEVRDHAHGEAVATALRAAGFGVTRE
jgi:threonine dehydratase